jgi:hypothetical protein
MYQDRVGLTGVCCATRASIEAKIDTETHLNAISSITSCGRVDFTVAPRLPERGPDVAWRHNVDTNVVGCLVDGKTLGKRSNGSLGCRVRRCFALQTLGRVIGSVR